MTPFSPSLPAKVLARRKVFLATSLVCFVALLSVTGLGLKRVPPAPLWRGETKFSAKNAYEWTGKLAKGFPNRVPWRPEKKAATRFLKQELKKLGYEPRGQVFSEKIGTQTYEDLENVYAIKEGSGRLKDEYLVLAAHYDITDTTVEGATDDASGVGAVLELARIFKDVPTNRTLVFLFTDSEEFGAFWGAHAFSQGFEQRGKIVSAITLDFVAPEKQEAIMILTDGLQRGYTPLWLREIALASVRSLPYEAEDTKNFLELVQRAILIPPADHGAFLHHGIPALNLFGRGSDFARQMRVFHHTPEDKMENLREESFEPYGRAAEIMVRSIDAINEPLNTPERKATEYWKLSDRYYLTGTAAHLVLALLFVPFLAYFVLLFGNLVKKGRVRMLRTLRNEARGFAITMLSLLAGYVTLKILPLLKIIDSYEMFPATQKSKILYNPNYLALALTAAVVVLLYVVFSRQLSKSRKRALKASDEELRVRHSLLGVILGMIVFFGFIKNPYLATLMLLPPAYLWLLMKNSRKFDSRRMNFLLFLGGFLSFLAVCTIMATVFHVGVFYWYLFLSLAYGLVSIYAAVLSLAVIAIGIRLLRNFIL